MTQRTIQLSQYPRIVKDTVRPFRIWDSVKKKEVPYRNYATKERALESALILMYWERVGCSFEVFDLRFGRWLSTFTRGVKEVVIDQPKAITTSKKEASA